MEKQRARSAGEKAQRRQDIIDAASGLLDVIELDEFAMAAVADELGLAKGTLYRYFPTREGLLLAVLHQEYAAWFDQVDGALLGLIERDPAVGSRADDVAELLVASLVSRPRFLRMAAAAQSVLERNVPHETARSFKQFLLERSAVTGHVLGSALGMSRVAGVRLLVHLNAGVVGLHGAAHPAPVVAAVLAQPEFRPLRVDLPRELRLLTHALITALIRS